MRTQILWMLLAIPCFASPDTRVDWPGFRGPNGSGVASAAGLPVEMGPKKNLAWKTDVPPGHSSPALTESRLFLTAADGDKLLTLCLNRASGSILWRREAPRSRNTKLRAKNSASSPSPVTDGENVYVFFEDFGMLSYTTDPYYEDSILPVVESGQAEFVAMDHDIDDHVCLEPSAGHTPGHVSVRTRSGGAQVVMFGDIMHTALQCAEPDLNSCFCIDLEQALRTRRDFLDGHADTPVLVMPAHFPTPTAGWIRKHESAFRFHFDYQK